jgi:hypothetical protein
MASPYPTGTFTLQGTPGCAWRANGLKIHVARSRHIIYVEQPDTLLLSSMLPGLSREKWENDSLWILLGKMWNVMPDGDRIVSKKLPDEIDLSSVLT